MSSSEENDGQDSAGNSTGTINGKDSNEEEVSITFDFGDDLEASVVLFGAKTVHHWFCMKARVSMRNKFYALLKDDEPLPTEEVLAKMSEWKPTISKGRTKKSSHDKAISAAMEMTPEARAVLMEELRASLT